MSAHKLAVYGTLKRNNSNNYLMRGSKFLGAGKTKENFTLSGLMVFQEPATAPVIIDLFEVDDEKLTGPLDSLEANGSVYNREKTTVVLDEGGEEHEAWLYFGLPAYAKARFAVDNPPKPNDNGAYNWGK